MKIGQGLIPAAFGTIFLLLIAGCGQKSTQPPEKIVLGTQMIAHVAPVWIAENKGYFRGEGLKVEIREFASGQAALKGLLNDKDIDLATAAQTPAIYNSFHRNDYAIIGGMVFSDRDIKILARQDRGIKDPENLKGKIVGITTGTTSHFFLSLFLTYHQMQMSDLKIIDLEPPGLSTALGEGRVDAIVSWEPHIYKARKNLGEKAFFLPTQGLFRDDVYLITRKDYLKDHAEALKRFFRAIEKAEAFILNSRNESMEIVGQKLKINKEGIKPIWDDLHFKLFLDQSILISLEDQARWAIRNRLTDAEKVPNYLTYIYPDILEAIKPEAVKIAGR
jgi:NitT/TauT family transport system substrate-binding protein